MELTTVASRGPKPCRSGGGGFLRLLRQPMTPAVGVTLAAIAALLWAPMAVAGEAPDADVTSASRMRLLPVPIFITEPSIGQGLGVSLMLIHPRSHGRTALAHVEIPDTEIEVEGGSRRPPDVTAVFGAATDEGTWIGGMAHSASWRADRVRFGAGLAWMNVNSTTYIRDRPVDFNSRGAVLLQDVRFRVSSSRLFVGGKISAYRVDTGLELDLGEDGPIQVGLGDTTDVGLAAQGVFDGRDTTFTPSRGRLLRVELWRHDTSLGGDFDYWKTKLKALSFHPLTVDWVLGVRFEGALASGDPPFWSYPWITLRGVPAMRYQDERAAAVEAELRWNVLPRWAVVGFLGCGATDGDLDRFESQDPLLAGGIGGRYLFADDLGLWVGVDVARGPEEYVGYIQVGHAW